MRVTSIQTDVYTSAMKFTMSMNESIYFSSKVSGVVVPFEITTFQLAVMFRVLGYEFGTLGHTLFVIVWDEGDQGRCTGICCESTYIYLMVWQPTIGERFQFVEIIIITGDDKELHCLNFNRSMKVNVLYSKEERDKILTNWWSLSDINQCKNDMGIK